ncbi:hypothetical protein BVC80_7009g2 [Macleaya cordata]|uniref:Uncharacterized protein n=1 Tax=Macleaya cordata TaxID=56857 RepID=A0A200Q5A1_MACCD|nr:hypothetical protein BVC80_7009g2 [Macleaya cordata]
MIDKVNWRTEYLSLVNMEDRKWQQKMKELWVGDGERNTKFYHCYANKLLKSGGRINRRS